GGGLTATQKAGGGKTIHALGPVGKLAGTLANAWPKGQSVGDAPVKRNLTRISSAIGEVKLNINKATHGLAHGPVTSGNVRNASKDSSSIWSDAKGGSASSVAQGSSNGGSSGAGASTSSSTSSAAGTSAAAAPP